MTLPHSQPPGSASSGTRNDRLPTEKRGLPATYDADRAAVVAEMRRLVSLASTGVGALCAYHLGWADATGAPAEAPAGKMLRPTLCLAVCRGYGDAGQAVGVAAAIELVHAFSLVHDDIEDGDHLRHGRTTLWVTAGLPLALNAGDFLFGLANRALCEAAQALPPDRRSEAFELFTTAYLRMIEGQHLDIEFEQRDRVTPEEYARMVRGKTGALIGASLALGALFGGAPVTDVATLREAGVELGLAFQAVDDALAVWGDPAVTGKAVGNDLARGKKSLPLVLAVERGWTPADGGADSLEALRAAFEQLGVREAVDRFARGRADRALERLHATQMRPEARSVLEELFAFVLTRQS
jgi:geranylgeranyl diphosphate synthase type I